MDKPFKEEYDLESRQQESQRIREKYPNSIPVIVEPKNGLDAPKLDKNKFLVPDEFTMGQFIHVVRKRIEKLKSDQALFFFVDNELIAPMSMMGQLYEQKQEEDGYLHIVYSTESTFGECSNKVTRIFIKQMQLTSG